MPPTPAPHTSWTQADYLALRYRPDLHLLVGRWQRLVSAAEFRQGYEATLRAAREVGCPFWQLDIRSRHSPGEATIHWLLQEFIPQLPAQLSSPTCLAYLLRPSHFADSPPMPTASPGVRVAFFFEEGPLNTWLTQCQHRSRAALLAAGFTPPPPAA